MGEKSAGSCRCKYLLIVVKTLCYIAPCTVLNFSERLGKYSSSCGTKDYYFTLCCTDTSMVFKRHQLLLYGQTVEDTFMKYII